MAIGDEASASARIELRVEEKKILLQLYDSLVRLVDFSCFIVCYRLSSCEMLFAYA